MKPIKAWAIVTNGKPETMMDGTLFLWPSKRIAEGCLLSQKSSKVIQVEIREVEGKKK